MYSYHGWLCSSSELDIQFLKAKVQKFIYPISIELVNGSVHVSFSGNPNRDRGELKETLKLLLNSSFDFHGVIYVNDANDQKNAEYKVMKIFNDSVTESTESYFSKEELNEIFL